MPAAHWRQRTRGNCLCEHARPPRPRVILDGPNGGCAANRVAGRGFGCLRSRRGDSAAGRERAGALAIGLIGGALLLRRDVKNKFRFDDTLDAFGIHAWVHGRALLTGVLHVAVNEAARTACSTETRCNW